MTQLTKEEALAAAAAVRPVCEALEDLLDNPVLQLPEGVVNWEKAKELQLVHRGALLTLNNIAAGQ
jgi:hypothetical protein